MAIASINPAEFKTVMEDIASQAMEDAQMYGFNKDKDIDEWVSWSIRVQLPGLMLTLEDASCKLGISSTSGLVKRLAWHWAAHCQTNEVLGGARSGYDDAREILTSTHYTDLDDRLKHSSMYSLKGHEILPAPRKLYLSQQPAAVIKRSAVSVGIEGPLFFQIGLGWSLSTNHHGWFRDRIDEFYKPEFDNMIAVAKKRAREFAEIGVITKFRSEWDTCH